ncbi:MAG: hypothetical protein M1818_005199 [Claussenomyces sp. TS43310]|nr:MAG: hypothetical protein M1818_005199 [Claussenomyces sp. TS43310]
MKTRSRLPAKTAADAVATAASTAQKVTLKPECTNPPKLFVLPKDTSESARILSLASPSTGILSRYLYCPEKGFYEFTDVGAPETSPRSWLITPVESESGARPSPDEKAEENGEYNASESYVSKSASLFVATPIDPLFFLLPALAPPPQSASTSKRLFLEADEYLDVLAATSPHFRFILRSDASRAVLESRMAAVCDTVEASDETMYRLNEDELLRELLAKAQRMVAHGLPVSMEERFVRRALQVPMLSLKREASSLHELAEEDKDEDSQQTPLSTPGLDSQTTISTSESLKTASSDDVTAATTDEARESRKPDPTPIDAPEGIIHLLRLQTAFHFILSSYLPPHLSHSLKTILSGSAPDPTSPASTGSEHPIVDFSPLDAHLAHLAGLRQQELASRSLGDFSRKRALDEDDENGETRAEKKRRRDEEERKQKAGVSRGVRDLKKVNVSGMKKMSDFFKKK